MQAENRFLPITPIILIVEVAPGLLPDLGPKRAEVRDKATIAKLVAEGRLSLDCAEGAMGMEGAGDGFPAPALS
ncbi:MAG: hypothetical protein ACTHLH_03885 [Solirubrobacterales bacterium]